MQPKKIPYAFLRLKKLHLRHLASTFMHNLRERDVPNASANGQVLAVLGESTAAGIQAVITSRYEAYKQERLAAPRTVRGARVHKDPVVAVEPPLQDRVAVPHRLRTSAGSNCCSSRPV